MEHKNVHIRTSLERMVRIPVSNMGMITSETSRDDTIGSILVERTAVLFPVDEIVFMTHYFENELMAYERCNGFEISNWFGALSFGLVTVF
jgi:hypothetical protein